MDNITNNIGLTLPEERGWEYKQICVTRVPGYGFGIAVSGGRDNPHFASGDPSIAVSDVLASGPAERLLQVNDRIISVNGISLQNVDYATAVQVLRDSGDTVTLVIKRRTIQHSHSHSHSASFNGPPLPAIGVNNSLPTKVTLTKNSKKEDFGIVLGCKLFIKEISPKARDQLLNTNQALEVGDFVTKLNNTNCTDMMSLKEAKKIIDGSKDKLQITVAREFGYNSNVSHQPQSSISTTGAVNNFYKDGVICQIIIRNLSGTGETGPNIGIKKKNECGKVIHYLFKKNELPKTPKLRLFHSTRISPTKLASLGAESKLKFAEKK